MKDPSTTTEDNLEKLLQTEHLHYICQIYLMANDNGGILKYKMQEIMSTLHYILCNISNPGDRVNRTRRKSNAASMLQFYLATSSRSGHQLHKKQYNSE
jgi:hypothetical protein